MLEIGHALRDYRRSVKLQVIPHTISHTDPVDPYLEPLHYIMQDAPCSALGSVRPQASSRSWVSTAEKVEPRGLFVQMICDDGYPVSSGVICPFVVGGSYPLNSTQGSPHE